MGISGNRDLTPGMKSRSINSRSSSAANLLFHCTGKMMLSSFRRGASLMRLTIVLASLFVVLYFPTPSFPQASANAPASTPSTALPARAGVNGVGVPACISCPYPSYTKKARAAKFEGTVILHVIITADGLAEDVKLMRGTGKDLGLEENAIKAVKNWRFKPALGADGKPTTISMPIEVTFRLH
jgi:TonB family protein